MLADDGTVAYVSNEGGRPANTATSPTSPTARRSSSSPSTGAAITGTVSVVNLDTGKEIKEIPVGLQPTALYQDGNALFVANSNDDSLSVIDEKTNTVTQTVNDQPGPRRAGRQLRRTRSTCPTRTTCSSASGATTRSRCTATTACTRRCSSSA